MADEQGELEGLQQLNTRQASILKTLIDISQIITESHGLTETLEHTVQLVARSLQVDVCSIYIYNAETNLLELRATHGLRPEAVGRVAMPVNEGLVGYVFETKAHQNVRDVGEHPRFKYFPEIDEERLSSFLGVPLVEYRQTLGVLAVQNQENRLFRQEEEQLLITIASQISGLVSKALLVDRIRQEPAEERREQSFQLEGVPVAPGLAMDQPVIVGQDRLEEPEYAAAHPPEEEQALLEAAVNHSEREILELIDEISTRVNEQEAAIFHAHLLFLEDRAFIGRISEYIARGASAAWAVTHVVRDYLRGFRAIDDPYLRERAADLEDVGLRLLRHLGHGRTEALVSEEGGILVAEMLTPSMTARMDTTRIRGILTAVGGPVSHAAILARSLRIPAITGVDNVTGLLQADDMVMLDGNAGRIYVNPDESISREYERYQETRLEYLSHLEELRDVPCCTRDEHRIHLRGNVGLAQDLEDCRTYGAEGVGLYRTEVPYLLRTTRPGVDELVEIFAGATGQLDGEPVVFRTLDLSGERSPTYLNFPPEANPYMGCRSIRYQLEHRGLLEDQFMALLHVADRGGADVRVGIPLISTLAELQEVRRILNTCQERFSREEGRPAPHLPLGMIFEVPATLVTCEVFLNELDFVSLGSNDLTQYMMAVDRNNPHVSHLFDPLEPAVLRLVKHLVDAAAAEGKPVLLTGELASDPEGCLIMVGLGVRELSMNAPLIPIMKDRFAQYSLAQLESLAQMALTSTSAENVRRNIRVFHHG